VSDEVQQLNEPTIHASRVTNYLTNHGLPLIGTAQQIVTLPSIL